LPLLHKLAHILLLLWARRAVVRFRGAMAKTPHQQSVADKDSSLDENFPDPWFGRISAPL
jgi:hypothetical protein